MKYHVGWTRFALGHLAKTAIPRSAKSSTPIPHKTRAGQGHTLGAFAQQQDAKHGVEASALIVISHDPSSAEHAAASQMVYGRPSFSRRSCYQASRLLRLRSDGLQSLAFDHDRNGAAPPAARGHIRVGTDHASLPVSSAGEGVVRRRCGGACAAFQHV